MCFHVSQVQKVDQIEAAYGVSSSASSERELFNQPRYHMNGFSHEQLLIIPQQKNSVLTKATWGIAPESKRVSELKAYYKEAVKFGGGLNARSEKVFSHFLYRKSIMQKRCIIPVSAFFEPHEYQKKKYPFVFQSQNEKFLSLAGIYTQVENLITFTILTQKASSLFEKVHNQKKRQPVILSQDLVSKWLSDALTISEIELILKSHFGEENLSYFPVSRDVFKPQINSNQEYILKMENYPELNWFK